MSKRHKKMGLIFLAVFLMTAAFSPAHAETDGAPIPAFPEAEGGGMYTTGGRGGEVYEVTNLNDSGPGSLRDAVSTGNRTVVFRVSGNLLLESPLRIRGSNITIAGQTAPGDGISINNHSTYIEADNVIIRYLRFRMGDHTKSTGDSMSARKRRNIIIDHCSITWGVDEVLSPYDNANTTVQWSIIGEAMHMSKHSKGRHGFGGLWGSNNASYHHNLIIHNSSRNPRLKGTNDIDKRFDLRNNVIYNWNYLSAYGGNSADINMINNYFKYGPDTLVNKRSQLLTQTGSIGKLYVGGNVIDGDPVVTANNWLGVNADSGKEIMNEPIVVTPVTTHGAEEAYELVLNQAGAILPKRDSIDARLVSDVRNRTGRQINHPEEVGGWTELFSAPAPQDSDHDGMPDEWELGNGLNPHDSDDRNGDLDSDGYTNLEEYLNAIAGNGSINPEVRIVAPETDQLKELQGKINIVAHAYDPDGSIAKVAFYASGQLLGEDDKAPYQYIWDNLPEGTYFLTAKAVDNSGTSTDSTPVPVHINASGGIAPWHSTDIGSPGIAGHADLRDGRFTVKGGGNIVPLFGNNSGLTERDQSFHYVYRQLEGDVELVARLDSLTETAPHNRSGLMIRQTLEPASAEAMIGFSVRGDQYCSVFYSRAGAGGPMSQTPPIPSLNTPYWFKLVKNGDLVTGYHSSDGVNWTEVSSAAFPADGPFYIGFAVDAGDENNPVEHYNTSVFSEVRLVTP
ncbi:Ig-like domain-containing protein [Paenibacillus tarimensis]